jgi:hypothetical protein
MALVSLGKWRFPHPDLWQAAAAAVQQGTAAVTTADGDAGTIEADAAARPVSLKFTIGQDSFSITDPLNSLLLPSVDERQGALAERRAWVDSDNASFAELSAKIATMSSPSDRIDAVLSWKDRSSSATYDGLREHIGAGGAFQWKDIEPPPSQSLQGRLRLPAQAPWAEAIGRAAEILVREEGLPASLARLSGLPCDLPPAVGEALAATTVEGRRSILRAFSSAALSPVARLHAIRLVLASGDPELTPEAKRHLALLASEGRASCRAVLVLLTCAWDELSDRADAELDATKRLACAWSHAHEVYSVMRGLGVPDDWISGLGSRRRLHPASLFGAEQTARQDLASPSHCTGESLLLFGLAYAVENATGEANVLTDEDCDRLVQHLTIETESQRFPHLSLLRNRALAPNGLRSFLHWRPSVDRLLPDSVASLLRTEKLAEWTNEHLDRLAIDPNQLRMWIDLACIVGDFSLPESDQRERLLAAIKAVDFGRLAEPPSEAGGVMIALHFMCLQLAYGSSIGAEAEPTLLNAARALASRWPRAQECGDNLWLLFEACALAARQPGGPAASAARMADLMRRLLAAWPTAAPIMRTTVQALSDQLPLEESRELWSLLTHLRSVA